MPVRTAQRARAEAAFTTKAEVILTLTLHLLGLKAGANREDDKRIEGVAIKLAKLPLRDLQRMSKTLLPAPRPCHYCEGKGNFFAHHQGSGGDWYSFDAEECDYCGGTGVEDTPELPKEAKLTSWQRILTED